MIKNTLIILTFSLFAANAMAGTGLNCYEADQMEGESLGFCYDQTDKELNDVYKHAMSKRTKQGKDDLKNKQRAWLKQREAKCQAREDSAASYERAVAKDRCIIQENLKRIRLLEKM